MGYYKYTNGEAFTKNGENYTGYFHVSALNAYTGRSYTPTSMKLTPKENFISEMYLKEYETDNLFGNTIKLNENYSNKLDILNKTKTDELLGRINDNNVLIFKQLISVNPNIFNFHGNDFHFYGLSSTEVDIRENDVPSGKETYTHIDPFSYSEEWGFLDDAEIGELTVNSDESFNYSFSNGVDSYTLSGAFSNTSPIALQNSRSGMIYVYVDEEERKIVFIDDKINIYDYDIYKNCGNFVLIDQISTNFEKIKFGNDYRLEYIDSEINIYKKYNTSVFKTILIGDIDVENLIDIDIDIISDDISILHEKNDKFYVTKLVQFEFLKEDELKNINGTPKFIKLCEFDSNLMLIITDTQVELRFRSYPAYYGGILSSSDMLYLRDYLWNTTYERYSKIQIKWNSNAMKSNSLNPLTAVIKAYNGKIYAILHNIGRIYAVSQPVSEIYANDVPLDLPKKYKGSACTESSSGLFLNAEISKLVEDIITLYMNVNKLNLRGEDSTTVGLVKELELNLTDFKINSNETINVISLQRVLNSMIELQRSLLTS